MGFGFLFLVFFETGNLSLFSKNLVCIKNHFDLQKVEPMERPSLTPCVHA